MIFILSFWNFLPFNAIGFLELSTRFEFYSIFQHWIGWAPRQLLGRHFFYSHQAPYYFTLFFIHSIFMNLYPYRSDKHMNIYITRIYQHIKKRKLSKIYCSVSVSLLTFTLRMINRPTSISFYCLLISFDLSLFNFSIDVIVYMRSERERKDIIFFRLYLYENVEQFSYIPKSISLEKSV